MTISNMKHTTLSRLLLVLILLQPLLDVLSFWLNHFDLDNYVTLLLRLILLAATVLAGFQLSRRKRVYFLTGGVLLVFTLCHIAACCLFGYKDPLSDLTNLIRIYLLPLTALSFMTFLSALPEAESYIQRGFSLCLLLIALIALLSELTGTDPHTYANKSIGILGWFYTPSSQSAILCMLSPVFLVYSLDRWKKLWPLAFLLGLGFLFLFATRLAYFGLILTGLLLSVSVIFSGKEHRRQGLFLLVLTLVFLALYPVSPMVRNQSQVTANAALKQESIDILVSEDEAEGIAQGLGGDELSLYRLQSAYEEFLPGLVDNFGLLRTAEKYHYSTLASDLADVRRAKIAYSQLLLEDSPSLSRFFGMELSRWYYHGAREFKTQWGIAIDSYDVENDFYGVYYLCGVAGLLLLLLFLGYYVVLVLRALIRRPRLLLQPEFMALCLSAALCAAHIYATAGVLRRPNASFYLAILLALLWHRAKAVLDQH